MRIFLLATLVALATAAPSPKKRPQRQLLDGSYSYSGAFGVPQSSVHTLSYSGSGNIDHLAQQGGAFSSDIGGAFSSDIGGAFQQAFTTASPIPDAASLGFSTAAPFDSSSFQQVSFQSTPSPLEYSGGFQQSFGGSNGAFDASAFTGGLSASSGLGASEFTGGLSSSDVGALAFNSANQAAGPAITSFQVSTAAPEFVNYQSGFNSDASSAVNFNGANQAGASGFQVSTPAPAFAANYHQSAGVTPSSIDVVSPTSGGSINEAFGGDSVVVGDGPVVEPKVVKNVYFYEAPEDEELVVKPRIQYENRQPTKSYKIIFVKAPSYKTNLPVEIPAPPAHEEKTLVYVLVKKPEAQAVINVKAGKAPVQTKPEVFFIKYKTQQEAEEAVAKIQNQQGIQEAHNGFAGGNKAAALDVSAVLQGKAFPEGSSVSGAGVLTESQVSALAANGDAHLVQHAPISSAALASLTGSAQFSPPAQQQVQEFVTVSTTTLSPVTAGPLAFASGSFNGAQQLTGVVSHGESNLDITHDGSSGAVSSSINVENHEDEEDNDDDEESSASAGSSSDEENSDDGESSDAADNYVDSSADASSQSGASANAEEPATDLTHNRQANKVEVEENTPVQKSTQVDSQKPHFEVSYPTKTVELNDVSISDVKAKRHPEDAIDSTAESSENLNIVELTQNTSVNSDSANVSVDNFTQNTPVNILAAEEILPAIAVEENSTFGISANLNLVDLTQNTPAGTVAAVEENLPAIAIQNSPANTATVEENSASGISENLNAVGLTQNTPTSIVAVEENSPANSPASTAAVEETSTPGISENLNAVGLTQNTPASIVTVEENSPAIAIELIQNTPANTAAVEENSTSGISTNLNAVDLTQNAPASTVAVEENSPAIAVELIQNSPANTAAVKETSTPGISENLNAVNLTQNTPASIVAAEENSPAIAIELIQNTPANTAAVEENSTSGVSTNLNAVDLTQNAPASTVAVEENSPAIAVELIQNTPANTAAVEETSTPGISAHLNVVDLIQGTLADIIAGEDNSPIQQTQDNNVIAEEVKTNKPQLEVSNQSHPVKRNDVPNNVNIKTKVSKPSLVIEVPFKTTRKPENVVESASENIHVVANFKRESGKEVGESRFYLPPVVTTKQPTASENIHVDFKRESEESVNNSRLYLPPFETTRKPETVKRESLEEVDDSRLHIPPSSPSASSRVESGWYILKDWNYQDFNGGDILKKLHVKYGVSPYFKIHVEPNPHVPGTSSIRISPSGLGLPDREYYYKDENDRVQVAYKEYIRDVITYLSSPKTAATKFAQDMFSYEKRIAEITPDLVSLQDPVNTYNAYTLAELTQTSKLINFYEILQAMYPEGNITENTEVIVTSKEYLDQVSQILASTDKRTVNGYLIWTLTRSYIPYLSDSYTGALDSFKSELFGISRPPERWEQCCQVVKSHMGLAVEFLLQKSNPINNETKAIVKDVFQNILAVAKMRILKFQNSVLLYRLLNAKLNGLTLQIGLPDQAKNQAFVREYYIPLQIIKSDYFDSIKNSFLFQRKLEQRMLMNKIQVNQILRRMSEEEPQVRYLEEENMVLVPRSLVEEPFFEKDFPNNFIYGRQGVEIAQAIISSIFPYGSLWTSEKKILSPFHSQKNDSLKTVEGPKNCLANYILELNIDVAVSRANETALRTLMKLAAVEIAHDALLIQNANKNHIHQPGLEEFEESELFFISYSQTQCSDSTSQYQTFQNVINFDLSQRSVIHLAWAQIPEFQKAFDCRQDKKIQCKNFF